MCILLYNKIIPRVSRGFLKVGRSCLTTLLKAELELSHQKMTLDVIKFAGIIVMSFLVLISLEIKYQNGFF